MPVIVNLHQVDVARRYSSRLVGLRRGRLVFDESPAGVRGTDLESLYVNERAPIVEVVRDIQPSHKSEGVLA